MLHHQPQVLSPLVETHSQSPNATSVRPRKMSAAGNRSWSEEEETYLLQTRLQKMPYKHIAAHLEKTELACRLHYHQLSHGSHRRRRNSSVSSTMSAVSVGQSPSFSMAADHDDCTQSPRQCSPISYTTSPHARSKSDTTFMRAQHKILLPRPHILTPRVSPEPHTALRIDTEVAHHPQIINTDRLRAIYEARRHQFWAAVAADYGSDVSPAHLEHLWRNGANTVRPPTPDASPDGTVLYNPVLVSKPSTSTSTTTSPFTYPSPAASEQNKHYSPMQQMNISAVSAPERTPYMLPMPVPSTGRPRAGTWSSAPRDNMPIASLLTEDKNPRDL
ncbi:hypothetical protein P153DRAFT_302087 [Dothidotthia symphoricarpi CBS 119687]|uniref:Myb-like domain-containing protein n=1 Tax=Dothidotthia symphoricarpi CBS 119687 TaxID=1392245 RepID=A0A6A6A0X2_9PLEO|nr:uncharacterized protein P153DRAFT_302087 [Dothidotthia symphoricarpi CBS 119687]KAF2124358.1 hypothetical protein P153DRAFT_302087 [Dothidotthia symphoricarpi CBS 119687]